MTFRMRPSSKKSSQEQERSLTQLPIPKSFMQNIQNDALSIRTMSNKLQQLQSNLYSLSQNNRRQRQISNASFIQFQKRVDLLQYKTFSVEKDVKQALDIKAIQSYNPGGSSYSQQEGLSPSAVGRNDFNMLKQAIIQERQSNRQFTTHQTALYQQLSVKQMKIEAELRQMFNQQKSQYDYMLRGQSQQLRSLQHIKERKLDQQYQMMKGVIASAERKIYDQLQRKIRNQSIMKDYVEEKIGELRSQIAAEQKTVLTAQTKFIRQAKQSMESLYTIIQNVKSQLGEQLSQTQKLSATNIKRLSMSIDIVKDSLNERLNSLQQGQQTVESEIIQFRSFMTQKLQENRQMMIQIEDAQIDRVDPPRSYQGNNDSHVSENGVPSNEKVAGLEKDISQWKTITQQKNLNVFKQISNTLKSIRLEWKKQNDQITSEIFSLKESVTSIKKSVPNQIKKSVQTIITIFNNEFDVLAEELDLITEMVALSKKEQEKLLKQETKKVNSEIIAEVKALMDKKYKQSTLYSQKAIAKSEQQSRGNLQKQSKYIVDILSQKQTNLQQEVNKVSISTKKTNQNTTSQLEDFTLKLKTFNENFKDHLEEQRKDDMKKRIDLQETMRKNANNLMDLTYKKCEFLVDGMKAAIEMNQIKDRLQLDQKVQILKDQNQRNFLLTTNQFKTQLKQAINKFNSQRQNSEEVMHQAMQLAVNNAKKALTIEMNNMRLEFEEKIAEGKGEDNEEMEEMVNALRESIWKLEAKSFSEEAKNKAIFDRMGEDIYQVSQNLTAMVVELKKNNQENQLQAVK